VLNHQESSSRQGLVCRRCTGRVQSWRPRLVWCGQKVGSTTVVLAPQGHFAALEGSALVLERGGGMERDESPRWLEWAREIQALSQTGLTFSENEYQTQRYTRLMAIAAEIVQDQAGLPKQPLLDLFSAQPGYATPKVDVRGAAVQDGRILLVQERMDGRWAMPGGWADVGDVPSEAAEREAWEEAGFHVKARRVIGVYDANRVGPLELFHAFKLVFLCDLIDGEARPSSETSEVAFFGPDEIPAHLSVNRTYMRHIEDAFRVFACPDLPTVFD